MMWRTVLTLALTAGLATQATAGVFRAENRVKVTPDGAGFLVPSGGDFGARGMWCAAADYAQDVLGAVGTDRIYVAATQGQTKRTPVRFTLDPTGLVPRSVVIVGASFRSPGGNLSVDHARSFCSDSKLTRR